MEYLNGVVLVRGRRSNDPCAEQLVQGRGQTRLSDAPERDRRLGKRPPSKALSPAVRIAVRQRLTLTRTWVGRSSGKPSVGGREVRFDRTGEPMLLAVSGEVETFGKAESEIRQGEIQGECHRPGAMVSRLDVGSARAGPENTINLMTFLTLPTGDAKVAANEEQASRDAHSKRRRGGTIIHLRRPVVRTWVCFLKNQSSESVWPRVNSCRAMARQPVVRP